MSLKQFYSELEKGMPGTAYLIHSEDAFQVKEAMLIIKDSVPPEERDFGFHAYDMESAESSLPVEKIMDVLNTPSFMGGRQTVVIEGAQKLKVAELKPMSAYLASPMPGTLLVLLYAGKLKKTTREHLKGATSISIAIREQDIPVWLMETARRKGLELTREAVDQLIGIVGTETGLLSSEVEKLAMYGRKSIDRKDIEELVKGFGDYSAFDLINALQKRDAKKVFSLYASISETQEPYSLLGALNWHYSRLKLGAEKREKIFGLLNEADFMVKSSGGAYPLEHLFSKLLRL
jgi:DNA polymerase-3 subunit delta